MLNSNWAAECAILFKVVGGCAACVQVGSWNASVRVVWIDARLANRSARDQVCKSSALDAACRAAWQHRTDEGRRGTDNRNWRRLHVIFSLCFFLVTLVVSIEAYVRWKAIHLSSHLYDFCHTPACHSPLTFNYISHYMHVQCKYCTTGMNI